MAARPRGVDRVSRRALLGAGAAVTLVGCSDPPRTSSPRVRRIRYAHEHPDQFADLRRPDRTPVGTLVLLHGGYWMPGYDLDQLDPVADEMTRAGWATWNVEYRRTGEGGEWPNALTDVAMAVDRLRQEDLAARVVLLGHSAGGHLAVWAASRTDRTPGGPPQVRPSAAISLAGVLDLTRAASAPGSADAVTAFTGGGPSEQPERYALSDPALLVPAACPVWAVSAEDDQVVPPDQATSYVDSARATGAPAELVSVPGDHYTLIDPEASSFATIRSLITESGA